MGLFKKRHETNVYETASGWNFSCSCGTHGRAIRNKREITDKARWHREAAR